MVPAVLRFEDIYPGSQIQIFSIPDPGSKRFPRPHQRIKYFNPKNLFPSSWKYDHFGAVPDPQIRTSD
jgi:hypothetical protein